MPRCPRHKTELVPLGQLAYVCNRCDYKEFRRDKYWEPEVRHVVDIPSGFSWSSWTLTGCEASGDNLVMSTGEVSATALSPEISVANSTKEVTRKKNISKSKIVWTHTANDGKIRYACSNDGGSNYTQLKTSDAIFRLNHGNEFTKQDYYYDLRLLITLTRSSAGDTSPSVARALLTHNYV